MRGYGDKRGLRVVCVCVCGSLISNTLTSTSTPQTSRCGRALEEGTGVHHFSSTGCVIALSRPDGIMRSYTKKWLIFNAFSLLCKWNALKKKRCRCCVTLMRASHQNALSTWCCWSDRSQTVRVRVQVRLEANLTSLSVSNSAKKNACMSCNQHLT